LSEALANKFYKREVIWEFDNWELLYPSFGGKEHNAQGVTGFNELLLNSVGNLSQ
jgi:hypothetical protein